MTITLLIAVISVSIIGLLLFLFFKARSELRVLKEKFGSIIDVDTERSRIRKDIESLTAEQEKTKAEFEGRKDRLIAEYKSAHEIFEKLQREVGLLEESIEMIEFGVYKPHFDFKSSDEYRRQLEGIRETEKEYIKEGKAVVCNVDWAVGGSVAEGKKMIRQTQKLMLRAFNGECDAAVAKVRWDNATKMEERIRKAYETINKSGEVNKIFVTRVYLDLKIKELQLAFEYQEKIKEEKDEQRRIQEEMREEEVARREIERAREDAEKEESRYQRALEKAREDVLKASGEKLSQLNEKIEQLESQLLQAQELKARAISRAQITKSGHVYIISNVGSFGENVYKIGMTRRLEPIDRVKELGDASVPFAFDVHALVYSDNAPELEAKLHSHFEKGRINLVNPRKEFFAVKLDEIEKWAKDAKIQLQLTKIVEAREYRESMAIRERGEQAVESAVQQNIPAALDAMFSAEEDNGRTE